MTQQSHYWFIPCGVCVCVCVCVQLLSLVWLFATARTVAHQALLSMEFPRQEYWSWLPFPTPGDLPNLGVEHVTLVYPTLAGRSFTTLPCPERTITQKYPCTQMFSSVQTLSCNPLFVTPWTAVHQASLAITNSWSCSNSCALSWWCHPTTSSSVIPFFCLQSFPASFPMSQFFISGGQSIGASTSVLPKNTQDWSPLGWTGLITLQFKGLSRVFFNTTVQKHQLFSAQLYVPTLLSIHDYWENHSFN